MRLTPPLVSMAVLSGLATVSSADQPEMLAPVIVTAARTAETADQSLASVTVIGRGEIERSQAGSVAELISGLAGVNLAANGGVGKSKSLYLRGTNSSHTLLLIDGIRVGSATLGTPAWALIPVENIERIEIVRGPRSSLYGSDAIGGVIQIFTRKSSSEDTTTLSAGIGSHNRIRLNAALARGYDTGSYNLSVGGEKTDGYDTHADSETDSDGYHNLSVNGGFNHTLGEGLELSGHLLRSQGENEFDGSGYTGNTDDFVQQSFGLALAARVNSLWESRLRIGQSRDESDAAYNGSFVSSFNTRRDQLSWENDIDLSDSSLLTAGFDYLNDHVAGSTAYTITKRSNKALFAQYRHFGDRSDLQFGLRKDDNEQFGQHATGNIALGLELDDNLRFTASVGTAFKAPTFNDLYWPATPWSSGNPNLQAEKSLSYELGLEGDYATIQWSIRGHRSKIENLIDWACTANCNDADPWNDFYQPSNVADAKIEGLELQAGTALYGWDSRITLNLIDPVNESTGNTLPKRTRRSIRLDLDRNFGSWSLGGTLLSEDGRWNNPANTVRLGGYTTLGLRAGYRIDSSWRVQGSIDNLLDRDYETSDGYPMPGREFFVSIIYQPK
ncbi:MAG: TonB-dependent vitamin B12 receptor [Candidatus Sedimenticola sp. PURPLELP]